MVRRNVIAMPDIYNRAYLKLGQTGSGKTYTMMGGELGCAEEGLTPRLCRDILLEVNNRKGTKDVTSGGFVSEMKMLLSFFEIYNERVHDLLKEQPEEPCRVREHPDKGAFVEGLTHREVMCFDDVAGVIKEGLQRRQTAETLMNSQSSRSHAVLSVLVTQEVVFSFGEENDGHDSSPEVGRHKDPSSPRGLQSPPPRVMRRGSSKGIDANGRRSINRVGKVCLVDLAGSERLYSTGASGKRLKEGTYINLSLSTLGDVIKALSERSDHSPEAKFVPYRNSVLTYVLKDSIGGNSRTTMIANISPTVAAFSESVNTLRFITKAKLITNRVSINESSEDNKYIQNLHKQIALIKTKLASTMSEMCRQESSHEAQVQSLKKQLAAANAVIAVNALKLARREADLSSEGSQENGQGDAAPSEAVLHVTESLGDSRRHQRRSRMGGSTARTEIEDSERDTSVPGTGCTSDSGQTVSNGLVPTVLPPMSERTSESAVTRCGGTTSCGDPGSLLRVRDTTPNLTDSNVSVPSQERSGQHSGSGSLSLRDLRISVSVNSGSVDMNGSGRSERCYSGDSLYTVKSRDSQDMLSVCSALESARMGCDENGVDDHASRSYPSVAGLEGGPGYEEMDLAVQEEEGVLADALCASERKSTFAASDTEDRIELLQVSDLCTTCVYVLPVLLGTWNY